jgi:glycosyltransferase involved in cell wall biosynthesis
MSDCKLSICIATLNRATFIGETLESILPQITGEVELVILDGGSTDGTDRIIAQYAERCPRLRNVRQDKAHGVDRDFDRVVELACGEYCWLMTDDDLLKPGAVQSVLGALRNNPALVIVNSEVRNHDLTGLVEARRLAFDSDRIYASGEMDRLLVETGSYLTFIGCVVINRQIWMARERSPYYGSLFIHVGVIFQQPLPGDTLVIAAVLMSLRYGNAMWRPREFEIWMFKWPTLIWSLHGPSESAKARLCAPEPWREIPRLIFFRAKAAYSLGDYRRWIEPRVRSVWHAAAAKFVALTPGALANVIAVIYYTLLPSTSRLSLYDTKSSRYYFRNWFKSRLSASS